MLIYCRNTLQLLHQTQDAEAFFAFFLSFFPPVSLSLSVKVTPVRVSCLLCRWHSSSSSLPLSVIHSHSAPVITVHHVRLHYVNSGGVHKARGLFLFPALATATVYVAVDIRTCLCDISVMTPFPFPFTDTNTHTQKHTQVFFSEAALLTRLLAVVSPTQINP